MVGLPTLTACSDTPFRHTPTQQISSVRSLYSLSVTRSHHQPPGAGSLFSHLLPSSVNRCPSGCQSVLCRSSLSFLTWNFSFCLCFVSPKSFLILLCAVPIHLTLMSVHHPIPGSFTIQRGNWITRVQGHVCHPRQVCRRHTSSSVVPVLRVCMGEMSLSTGGCPTWLCSLRCPSNDFSHHLWAPSMFQAQCYSTT